jgi:hypothetical protein
MTVRKFFLTLAVVLGAVVPATASAAKPPAATLHDPAVTWVRVGVVTPAAGETSRLAGRVVVRVLVRHAPIADAAADLRSVGSVSIILSRFEGDRNHSIGGGSAARALPILAEPLDVVYQVTINASQSAAIVAASKAGTLRSLVLVDQRAHARGRTPARSGTFSQTDSKVMMIGAQLPANAPPLLLGGGRRVVIAASANGYSIVRRVEIPLAGGRQLVLTTGKAPANGLVPADGSATALAGTVTIFGADGAKLAELPAPAGFALTVGTKAPQRGTLVWPAFDVPGTDPVPAGRAVLPSPSVKN